MSGSAASGGQLILAVFFGGFMAWRGGPPAAVAVPGGGRIACSPSPTQPPGRPCVGLGS